MPKTSPSTQGGQTGGPRSAVRVMDILYELSQEAGTLSLSHLSERLKLPKTSVFSLLRALEHGGYIKSVVGGYQLGPEAFKLASAISHHRVFPGVVRPVLERLAQETSETIILGVLDETGFEAKYIDVIESSKSLRFTVHIGDNRPLYCSAAGKIFLAHFSRERLQTYLSGVKREQFTASTLTRKSDLLADLEAIRKDSFAANIDGMTEGITSFGAPVYEHGSDLAAAIVISGPHTRMAPQAEAMKTLVMDAAHEMSRLLNSPGSYPPPQVSELT